MELYIGGYGQGKTAYVSGCFKGQKICMIEDPEELEQKEQTGSTTAEKEEEKLIWNHFHRWVQKKLSAGTESEQLHREVQEIINRYPHICIISDEVGNGIVPIEKSDRLYRECVGRLQCELAQKSEKVVRIFCGIGQRIK